MRKKEPEINLHLGCSLQAMREMKDNQYDLAIVDPPYGKKPMRDCNMGILDCNFGRNSDNWDIKPTDEYFEQVLRVSKNQIIWGANYFIENLYSTNSFIVWDKVKIGNIFADCEMAWTSFNSTAKIFKFQWHGMIQGDMKNKEKRIQPTQIPIVLYKWLLENYAKEGDKILDTHLGSGSIACACYDLGFDLDAWEIDKDYYKDTLLRYTEYSKQSKLF